VGGREGERGREATPLEGGWAKARGRRGRQLGTGGGRVRWQEEEGEGGEEEKV
jgi:hypothetical protein